MSRKRLSSFATPAIGSRGQYVGNCNPSFRAKPRDASMSNSSTIRIVHPGEFDTGTLQTPGSERQAAIAPQLGIKSTMWGGVFEVNPGARTGIHHHGEQQTIAYVLSGVCEVRWGPHGEFAASAEAGDFIHVPAFLPHMEINRSEFATVPMGGGAEHIDSDRGKSSRRYVALDLKWLGAQPSRKRFQHPDRRL